VPLSKDRTTGIGAWIDRAGFEGPEITKQRFEEFSVAVSPTEEPKMRIFSTAAILIWSLGFLTLTSCVEMQAVDVRPKSGALLIESTDVLYVKDLLAQAAKDYGLEPQKLVSSDMIASYEGGKKGPFSVGIAFILLWQHPNPSRLEVDISGPTPVGATILSKRIFREVKAKLIAHFGSDRIRDVSKTVVNPI
jgi:hypothetical protein